MAAVPGLLADRRSIRAFRSDPVPPDALDDLVAAACLAPAPHHSRPWRWVVLHTPEAKAALDSGNQLFRRKAYDQALVQYRRSSELAPQHSAPLFGIHLVAVATKNKALDDSAMAGIRARTGALPGGPSGAPHGTSDSALKALREQMMKGARAN